MVSSHVQPVRARTAGRGRPALATDVFLLVASLALSVSPVSPDARSFIHVLVQGDGAAAAVATAGGRSLAALPIVGGLLARVPADEAGQLSDHPGVRAVTDADRPLRVRAADPVPGGADPNPGGADPNPGVADPVPGGADPVPGGCGQPDATRVQFG